MVTGAVLKRFDPEGPYWVTWCTTTALLIAAAVEAGGHHLSLYTAIIVSYLCFLHTISSIWLLAVRNVCGDRKRALRYLPFTIVQMCGFAIYAFYIWSHAKDFGNQPECNPDTKFVFFFKDFSAVHTGPKIAIPILSILFLVGLVDAGRYVRMWTTNAPPQHERSSFLPPVVGLYVLAWVYVVATTELTIKRNWIIDDPSKFSFGQILPLVTIGIPIIAILLALRVRNRQTDSPQEQLIQELPADRPIAAQQMEEPSDFEQRGL